ncbi:MAG: site-specific DNA-methyltransferase [Ignavibacteriales bacterium]|nr:site-specific DNA-methyltransferase [Ignavibacteriales bacterium]
MAKKPTRKKQTKEVQTVPYRHPEATSPLRPDVGTQAQFRKKKPPKQYKFDSSLSPELNWDGQNPSREEGEMLIRQILDAKEIGEAKSAAERLKALSKPFLNWAGKAERLSFEVPTLPLFVHERLSTKAIIETLKGHKRDKQIDMFDLFGDPRRSVADQVLKAYEYPDKWVNRMILGDSLVVMNSLLQYENLGGQVQMIYIDPPYGVKFGSNFQPFVRKRDVSHNDDDDLTREPEMVKAYRDTWELGLHSYLTYMRDRLLLARNLLSPTGSVFVQISDENVHHVRELIEEVFGSENFVSLITFKKTTGLISNYLTNVNDFIIWFAKDIKLIKYRQLFLEKTVGGEGASHYTQVMLTDGKTKPITQEEILNPSILPEGARIYEASPMISQGNPYFEYEFNGKKFGGTYKTTKKGLDNLAKANRLEIMGKLLRYRRFYDDYPVYPITNVWEDILGIQSRTDPKIYVVQTSTTAIQRCLLMTTDPGDLVLDPTCGSGTTAYVAEQWGRRWITIDTSRVPLALARQRLLTATFSYYKLKDEQRGPVGGFVYERKQNNKGEEVGGIVPHVTLKSIANQEPPQEEVLVDRPEVINSITRVTGPISVEATIPTPVDWEGDDKEDSGTQEPYGSFVQRMLEVMRKSPVLHLDGEKTIQFKNVRPPAKSLSLSAEAMVEATAPGQKPSLRDAVVEADEKNKGMLPLSQKYVALVFGPENGAVSEKLVYEAAKEAAAKSDKYSHLYVVGFAIQPNARALVEKCDEAVGIPATYVQATPDLMMGDLLKNMRSSQIFSVCGLPEVKIKKLKQKNEPQQYQVELLGLDVFDPISMEVEHRKGDDVPAWFLDTDYNGLVFHVTQAFFPRTSAWDNLKKALKMSYEESVWDHLAGTTSAPFEAAEHKQIAVKVIDDRGNELLVAENLINID